MQQHPEKVGAAAVEPLLAELDGGPHSQNPSSPVGTELVVRESTAAPRA